MHPHSCRHVRVHTQMQTHASQFNENFHMCISRDLWFFTKQTVTDEWGEDVEFFLKRWFLCTHTPTVHTVYTTLPCYMKTPTCPFYFPGKNDSIGRTVSFMPYCIQWQNQHKLSKISYSPIGTKNSLYWNETAGTTAIKDCFDFRWSLNSREFSCP